MDYRTERYETVVNVPEYVRDCVDVQEFLPYCRECPNYNQVWSCPEFRFDPYDYWKKYQTLQIIGVKIIVPDEIVGRVWTAEECRKMIDEMLWGEKQKLSLELYEMEKQYPGSVSLSAGTCQLCPADKCTKREGKPCRNPEKLRYSIEALGGNVGLTVTKYLKQKLEWIEEGRMPHHFMLICGLLRADIPGNEKEIKKDQIRKRTDKNELSGNYRALPADRQGVSQSGGRPGLSDGVENTDGC